MDLFEHFYREFRESWEEELRDFLSASYAEDTLNVEVVEGLMRWAYLSGVYYERFNNEV